MASVNCAVQYSDAIIRFSFHPEGNFSLGHSHKRQSLGQAGAETCGPASYIESMAEYGEIVFRRGTLDDLDKVTAKVHEFGPKMLRAIGATEEQVDEWLMFYASRNRWRHRLESDDAAVFIAERDEVVVGIGYAQTFRDIEGALVCRLGGLYVRYSKQGIGTAIMKERLRYAKRKGVDYVQLETAEDNGVMRRLAERYGFQEHERYHHQILSTIAFIKYRRALTDFGEEYLLDIANDDEGNAS